MKPTVVMFTTWDTKSKLDVTRMVIIATDKGVVASGDPETMASMQADSINESFRGMTADELKTAVPDMISGYEGKTSTGYGASVNIMAYTGETKSTVDKIVADWTKARADKVTKKA